MSTPGAILTPGETRRLLERLGHHPRRKLGQNFLVDGNIVRKSLALADVQAGDMVVEIGPGLGTLTGALLEAGANVYAVEYDRTLYEHLRETLAARFPEHLHLLHGDAVEHPLAGFCPGNGADYKIVANLPYAISTPWLDGVLEQPVLPRRLVLMVQKEAADRLSAVPGSKSFGPIALCTAGAFERRPGHAVARRCFYPEPGVDSVLLVLERKAEPFLYPAAAKEKIRRIFTQRRKQIGALCRGDAMLEGWLGRTGLDPTLRPEQIGPEHWQRLPA